MGRGTTKNCNSKVSGIVQEGRTVAKPSHREGGGLRREGNSRDRVVKDREELPARGN